MGYGVQGPGPSPLLFTVLLQFVPFLNAEGWMEALLWLPPDSHRMEYSLVLKFLSSSILFTFSWGGRCLKKE